MLRQSTPHAEPCLVIASAQKLPRPSGAAPIVPATRGSAEPRNLTVPRLLMVGCGRYFGRSGIEQGDTV
jgi:hypothetical protein